MKPDSEIPFPIGPDWGKLLMCQREMVHSYWLRQDRIVGENAVISVTIGHDTGITWIWKTSAISVYKCQEYKKNPN